MIIDFLKNNNYLCHKKAMLMHICCTMIQSRGNQNVTNFL